MFSGRRVLGPSEDSSKIESIAIFITDLVLNLGISLFSQLILVFVGLHTTEPETALLRWLGNACDGVLQTGIALLSARSRCIPLPTGHLLCYRSSQIGSGCGDPAAGKTPTTRTRGHPLLDVGGC